MHAECFDSCDAELLEIVLRERRASAFSHSQDPKRTCETPNRRRVDSTYPEAGPRWPDRSRLDANQGRAPGSAYVSLAGVRSVQKLYRRETEETMLTCVLPVGRRGRSIRFWLGLLVVACTVPAMLVASSLIADAYTTARVNAERDILATTRALMQAVDADSTRTSGRNRPRPFVR